MTDFAVLIENEIAIVMNVPEDHKLNAILRSNPIVIDITDFPYNPSDGSIWNGEDFDIPEDLFPFPGDPYKEIYGDSTCVFAYVVNNICVGRTRFYKGSSSGETFIAAYKSNPDFADITEILENLETKAVSGMYLIDGQIVDEI